MKNIASKIATAAALTLSAACLVAQPASAVTVYGKLYLGASNRINKYSPSNSSHFASATVGPGTEFTYTSPGVLWSANFDGSDVHLTTGPGIWKDIFLVKIPGYFNGAVADCPPGDACHVTHDGEYLWVRGTRTSFSPATLSASAPEPGTWVLMIAGLGGLGLMMRGSRKVLPRQLAA